MSVHGRQQTSGKTSRRTARQSTRQGGYSVLELIIAVAVLSVTLIIAAEMLLARERQLARATRVANRMSVEQAVRLLKRDLRPAIAVGTSTQDGWQEGPMRIAQPGGIVVTWSRLGRTISRERRDNGVSQGARTLLDRAAGFRWRRNEPAGLALPLVEVEWGYTSGSEIVGTGRGGAERLETLVRRVRVAMRGARTRAW